MALDITEHAPELAGFAGVVAAVVPWSVSFSTAPFSGFVDFRFLFGSVRFVAGARSAGGDLIVTPVTDVGVLYGGPDLARMAALWLGAALLLSVILVVGVVLFATGERFTAGPLDPIRLVGGLCLCMALLLSGATWLLWQHTARTPIPVGLLALYFFGATFLTIDRSSVRDSAAEASG